MVEDASGGHGSLYFSILSARSVRHVCGSVWMRPQAERYSLSHGIGWDGKDDQLSG